MNARSESLINDRTHRLL